MQIYGLSQKDRDALQQLLTDAKRLPSQVQRPQTPRNFVPSLNFTNNEANQTIPAYGCFVVDSLSVTANVAYASAKRASTSNLYTGKSVLVNGHTAVENGKHGSAQRQRAGTLRILYDSSATPSVGQTWGLKPGQFTLSQYYPGFRFLGNWDSDGRVGIWMPEPTLILHGKADAKIANDSTGTFSVYIDKSTNSNIDVTVRVAEYAPDLFADEWATVHFHNGQWYYDESGKTIDGTLAGALAVGSSATMNVDPGSDTVTVHDAVMKTGTTDIASGKKIYASWFKLRKRWQVIQAECA